MSGATRPWRRLLTPAVAAGLVLGLYALARLPTLPPQERDEATARFRFSEHPLPEVPGVPHKSVRAVHPALQRISSWVSAVGAAVALADLDGDGLANDLCYVDPRTDQVIVAPVPGTPARYRPFVLTPDPLPYDPATMAPMGCLMADLNEDGLTDVLVYYWGRTPVAFLRKQPAGDSAAGPVSAADFVPREVVPGGERWYTNAATLADLDGDGHVDLVVGNYYPDGARVLDARADSRTTMQDGMSRAFNGGGVRLLLCTGMTAGQDPAVSFEEARGALDGVVPPGWVLAVGAADLDGDLLPELYVANDFGPDRLLHNRSSPGVLRFALLEGKRTLTSTASGVLGRDSFKGMGVDFADLNGDGLLDMIVSNITSEYALEESNFVFVSTGAVGRMRDGVAPYVNRSEALGLSRSGWGWDVKLADFDNDGVPEVVQALGFVKGRVNRWPELHELAMGNDALLHAPGSWPRIQPGDDLSGSQRFPFFVRCRDGRYYDLAPGLFPGEPRVGRGVAVADVDGDGRLDFAVANQWEPSFFYKNECPRPGAYLGLHLLLPLRPGGPENCTTRPGHPGSDTPGRPAIGAAASVALPDGRRFVAQVDGGNGHSGKRSPDLHFGLGSLPADSELAVELRWRDPEGRVRQETLRLRPGWHTVVLRGPAE